MSRNRNKIPKQNTAPSQALDPPSSKLMLRSNYIRIGIGLFVTGSTAWHFFNLFLQK